MDTRVSTGVTYSLGDSDQALHGGWQPLRVLGASSEFSLALPDAPHLSPRGPGPCGEARGPRVVGSRTPSGWGGAGAGVLMSSVVEPWRVPRVHQDGV